MVRAAAFLKSAWDGRGSGFHDSRHDSTHNQLQDGNGRGLLYGVLMGFIPTTHGDKQTKLGGVRV